MTTWGEYQPYVRSAVLKDTAADPSDYRWSEASVYAYFCQALKQFAAHTAATDTETYAIANATTSTLTLPADIYDDAVQTTVLVYNDGEKRVLLEGMALKPGMVLTEVAPGAVTYPRSFWEWPKGTLNLGFTLKNGTSADLWYFANWALPDDEGDDDYVLPIPSWAELPVAYLIGAFAAVAEGMQASNIRQWNTRPDTGTPEHNPLHRQTEHMMMLYRDLISWHPPQNRQTYFRQGAGI